MKLFGGWSSINITVFKLESTKIVTLGEDFLGADPDPLSNWIRIRT